MARLEAIRKQNYRERIEIQQRMAKVRGPVAKVVFLSLLQLDFHPFSMSYLLSCV
jgi:hypothetical protein